MMTLRRCSWRSAKFVAAFVASVALLGLVAGPAAAHDPIFLAADQTTPDTGPYMPDGTISWALYGSVVSAGDTRGFEFDLRDGDELYVSLLIPNLSPEIDLEDVDLPVLEMETPDGTIKTIGPEIREQFDEPFSGTSYVTLAELREPGQGGRYRGVVTGGAASRFTIAIGETEVFFTETERSGDRPSSFTQIVEPLQLWYSTPAGAEPSRELAEGEGEIDLEMVEEAMESGQASTPDAVEDASAPDAGDGVTDSGSSNLDADEVDDDSALDAVGDGVTDSGSSTMVAPLILVAVAVIGTTFFVIRRRSAA